MARGREEAAGPPEGRIAFLGRADVAPAGSRGARACNGSAGAGPALSVVLGAGTALASVGARDDEPCTGGSGGRWCP